MRLENPTDTERLDWLETMTSNGACPALLNDDNGHWAVSFDGVQDVQNGEEPETIWTSFVIEKAEWHDSLREAIDAAIITSKEEEEEDGGQEGGERPADAADGR